MKNLSELGSKLDRNELKSINGGFGLVGKPICLSPYLIDVGDSCAPGYHLHPQGHCICCRDI